MTPGGIPETKVNKDGHLEIFEPYESGDEDYAKHTVGAAAAASRGNHTNPKTAAQSTKT